MSGYVRLHRTLLGHPAFRNDAEAMVFAWMIAKAAWKPARVRYKGYDLLLDRGDLTVSVRDLAEAMDRSKGWVERLLQRLREHGMIAQKSGTRVGTRVGTHGGTSTGTPASIITICNYDEYQGDGEASGTPHETGGETAPGQRRDTEQRREELKKEEEEEEVARAREAADPVRSCFDAWNAMADLNRLPTAEKLTDKRRTHLRARIDDYTEAVILDAIAAVPSKPWLMGMNDRRWKADLDWLLRPDSITRLREGKYDHGQSPRHANDGGLCASPAEAMLAARRNLGFDR
ncbi:Rrf2 family transcriptional regulator [Rhizorhabdus wittichii]|uniref:Rrf2 family transcriptional regulator n=1 Tax=Rhizorhabdus wittichii TaxID=160791 RepID=UPI00036B4AB5|nr:Rrf2 family transcriptional regulator [Rhizorhabdus wittichii]